MNPLRELKLHVDALAAAVRENPKFFASVRHYIEQFQQLLDDAEQISTDEMRVLAQKLDGFWVQWRPTGDGLYVPPRETGDTDSAVRRISQLVDSLAALQESELLEIMGEMPTRPATVARAIVAQPCVFIGHGRTPTWARVKAFLEEELGLAVVTYESESRVGDSIVPILEKMLQQATFAVLVMTAEDASETGLRARQNVVHEAGLFQGRLGFKRAVLLVQRGTEEFSNVAGLQHIPFTDHRIEETFYELQRVLKRERQIAS